MKYLIALLGLLVMAPMAHAQEDQICTPLSEVNVTAVSIAKQVDGSYLILQPQYLLGEEVALFESTGKSGSDFRGVDQHFNGICKLFGYHRAGPTMVSTFELSESTYTAVVNAGGALFQFREWAPYSTYPTRIRVVDKITCWP